MTPGMTLCCFSVVKFLNVVKIKMDFQCLTFASLKSKKSPRCKMKDSYFERWSSFLIECSDVPVHCGDGDDDAFRWGGRRIHSNSVHIPTEFFTVVALHSIALLVVVSTT